MAKAELLMPLILKWEGGYSNHPNDNGGCTMKGITINTYRSFFGDSKNCSDLKNITDDEWLTIFKDGYWNPLKGDDILNQSIANIIVDWGWMSGVRTAAKKIQKILDVECDGKFGPITLTKLNKSDQEELFNSIYKERENFYYSICEKKPKQQCFLKGWLNRLEDYVFEEEPEVEIIEEKKEEDEKIHENDKKHFTDTMSDLGGAFLYK